MEKNSIEWRKAIAEDYRSGKPINSILVEYGTNSHKLMKCVDEFGVPRRYQPRPRRNRKSAIKKCSRCRKTIDIKDARFCPFCGNDIRSEADILQEKMNKLFSMLTMLPSNMRDEAQETIKAVSAYLKKEV